MNSKELTKRNFSEPVDFTEGGHEQVPSKVGVYVIIRKDKEIEYPIGKSDIVKIGKCVELGKGFTGRWHQYFNLGPMQHTEKRLKTIFLNSPHGFSWLELPSIKAKEVEKRLLNEFVRNHGQYPAYNLSRY